MAKREIITKFSWILVLILTLIIFRHWISLGSISAGDLGFFYPINIREYWQLPLSWESFRNSGLGGYAIPFQGAFFYNLPIGILSRLTTSFSLIQRLVWFWPILVFSLFSSWFFVKTFFPANVFLSLGSLILVFNTYFLMIVLGGQITVALAYAIFPLVLALFLSIVNKERPKPVQVIVFSLVLALLVAFDLRFAYLFFLIVFFYFLFHLFSQKFSLKTSFKLVKKYCFVFIPAGFIVTALHLYWLLPLFLIRRPALPAGYDQAGWVEFLSFADFSQALSLLHPNWPEGIFGKTYFMRPEFLLLPVLAFSSLLLTRMSGHLRGGRMDSSKVGLTISFFALLGLIGAFLAKGSRPPFGGIYLWLFNRLPGMSMFRDPTKFYVLIALSYSILISFSLEQLGSKNTSEVAEWTPRRWGGKRNRIQYLVFSIFILFWLFLIRPAWLGQLGGTFKAKEVPREYLILKDFIGDQDEFFRTFWVPQKQRFGFYSNNHPAIVAEAFVTDSVCREPFCSLKIEMPKEWGKDCLPNDRCYVRELAYFLNPQTAEVLSRMAVKYVVVPFDSEGEIFLGEREYNPQQREEAEQFLDTIPWLKKIDIKDTSEVADEGRTPRMVEGVAVYETPSHKDHFWVEGKSPKDTPASGPPAGGTLPVWRIINPTKYLVSVRIDQVPATLVFSETHDELWQARIGEEIISSVEYNTLNSFVLNQTGDFEVIVEFTPQKYVYWGLVVSGITLLTVAGYFVAKLLFINEFTG